MSLAALLAEWTKPERWPDSVASFGSILVFKSFIQKDRDVIDSLASVPCRYSTLMESDTNTGNQNSVINIWKD